MKETKIIMGMPITIEIVDQVDSSVMAKVFDYFRSVDEKFSTYKKTSEISQFNQKQLKRSDMSEEVKLVLQLCEQTRYETNGYFTIEHKGQMDPSGIVKGWAIVKAAEFLKKNGCKNFYIDAGGDIQVRGKNKEGKNWTVGIRNPFNREEIVTSLKLHEEGVATSGNYIRGEHIWGRSKENAIVSLTVIGPNVYDADRFATAAYAMGENGIRFIESLKGFEGYQIDEKGIGTMTSGFENYVYS